MKAKYVVPTLLLAGMASFANVAVASDEFAGVLIGTGSGAIIGHAMGGRDGAFVGGILGAMVGAAIADNDDRHTVVHHRDRRVYERPRVYAPPRVVVYEQPRVRYVNSPVVVYTHPAPPAWREYRDGRWDRGYRGDHGRWNHDRDGRRGW
ncbi:MAG: YMGG-like glycine zipper-containing protein [Pseudomonadota bacterium]|nr:YMGG-like glycine zipper-containing protein [Pseudomonadota bacterium]MDP1903898.1 YMGG-like glycine zipper-containing protein [Pseudomonadota bacterium]MDP2351137.1 YMGG-like glycine zipper-containing protein [Pseudomonadota bacterium]